MLTRESECAARFEDCLSGLEDQVQQFSGALTGFLGQIRLDDTLLLVPEARRIELISHTSSGGQSMGHSSIGLGILDEIDGTGTSSQAHSVAHTTSDAHDVRMEDPIPPSLLPTLPPLISDADAEMAPVQLPLIDLPPPIPTASQDAQWIVVASSLASIPIPMPQLALPTSSCPRSRSPLVLSVSDPHNPDDQDRRRGHSRTPL